MFPRRETSHPLWAQAPSQSKVLPCVQMDHSVFQLAPTASGLLTGHKLKEPGSIFFCNFPSGVCTFWWDPPWAFSSPSCIVPLLSLSSYEKCSRPFISFVGFHWTCSSSSSFISFFSGEFWTGHCTPDVVPLVLIEWKDHFPQAAVDSSSCRPGFVFLLAKAVCWPLSNLVSTSSPSPSCKSAFHLVSCSMCWSSLQHGAVPPPYMQDFPFTFVELHELLNCMSVHFSSLFRSLWLASWPSQFSIIN